MYTEECARIAMQPQWDVDSSGTVDPDEFREAIKTLGIDAPRSAIDALFHELDEDKLGELDYVALDRTLRRPRGQMAKQIKDRVDGTPRPSPLARTTIAKVTLANTLVRRTAAAAVPTAAEGAASVQARPTLPSSSRPPSPSNASSSDDDEEASGGAAKALADASELARYLHSTRLQEAIAQAAREEQARAIAAYRAQMRAAALRTRIQDRQETSLIPGRRRILYSQHRRGAARPTSAAQRPMLPPARTRHVPLGPPSDRAMRAPPRVPPQMGAHPRPLAYPTKGELMEACCHQPGSSYRYQQRRPATAR